MKYFTYLKICILILRFLIIWEFYKINKNSVNKYYNIIYYNLLMCFVYSSCVLKCFIN